MIGGYHQVGEFLSNVGSLARIVAPVNFQLATGNNASSRGALRPSARNVNRDGMTSVITLQTYVERTKPSARKVAMAAGTLQ